MGRWEQIRVFSWIQEGDVSLSGLHSFLSFLIKVTMSDISSRNLSQWRQGCGLTSGGGGAQPHKIPFPKN